MKTIKFMGVPKAGKTTQLKLIETYLRTERGASVRSIYEGARICPLDKNYRFLYNAWSFHSTVNKMMEAVKLGDFDYVLIDRGVYDHIAFTHALYLSGQISDEQLETQVRYFQEFISLEDLVLLFMVSPEEAMIRENKKYQSTGRVMNLDFLTLLHSAYEETVPIHKEGFCLVDGSKLLESNRKEVLEFLFHSD